MRPTEHRPSGTRRHSGVDPRSEPRMVRLFEVLLIASGGATGIWLVVSVLTSIHS